MSNVIDFLSKLESNPVPKLDTYIPSTKSTIQVTPLNFKQLSSILSSASDGTKGIMLFSRIITEIIIANTNRSDLKSYDKLPVILRLRAGSLGIVLGKKSIQGVYDRIESVPFDCITNQVIESNGLTLHLRYPDLQKELSIIKACEEAIAKKASTLPSDNINILYVYELAKYVSSISSGSDASINFDDISISDTIKILEKLPADIMLQISAFNEDYQKYEALILGDSGVTLDPSFFDK